MMKNLLASLFFFTLLCVIGIASVYGVLIPKNNPVKAVGSMQLSAFERGLALYQQNKPYYYTFSPYNDYIVSGEGIRSSLINGQELSKLSFKTDYKNSYLREIIDSLLGYFNLTAPNILYDTENYRVKYISESKDNKLLVSRYLSVNKGNLPPLSGMTVTYSGADFIFDKSGHLYNYQSDEDLKLFESLYGIHLDYQPEDLGTLLGDKTIFIMNPLLASTMAIKATDNQSLYLDRVNRIIEIQESGLKQGNFLRNTIEMEIFNNPKEAMQSL